MVYVGDEGRLQVFDANGRWKRDILLVSAASAPASAVSAVAVDSIGDIYLAYKTTTSRSGIVVENNNIVRKFNPDGEQMGQFVVMPRLAYAEAHIDGMAIGPADRLAVIGVEIGSNFYERFGFLYGGATGRIVGEFRPPKDNDGLTFDSRGDLYVAAADDQEVVGYIPVPAAELVTGPVRCEVAPAVATAAAFACALNGLGGLGT